MPKLLFIFASMNEIDYEEILSSHGIKVTANRLLIVRELGQASRPMSMMELETRIRTIDKSNIFRALNTFREHHLVHILEDGGDGVRYELCKSRQEGRDDDMHVHFYCESCHRTFCLEDIPVPSVSYPEGFQMETVNYMAKGLCPQCARKTSLNPRK